MIKIILLVIFALSSVTALADDSFFGGPLAGSTSFSTSNGSTNRDSQFSYGGEGYYIHDHWAAGLNYLYFAPGQQGNQLINVNQSNQWANVEGRFRIWDLNFSPYLSAGAGALFQSVSTSVMGSAEQTNGAFFVQDLGVGVMGKIIGHFGADFSVRYYQYSNVNGFNYYLSLGFFPDL